MSSLALGGAIAYDVNTFSDIEIDRVKSKANYSQLESYILKEVLKGRTPEVDISVYPLDEVSRAYMNVSIKLDDDFKGEEKNLAKRIRTKAKDKI